MFENTTRQKLGSTIAVVQGVITAVAPRTSAKIGSRMLEQNYQDAEGLEPTETYLRQIRALGIGLAAAGTAGFVMEVVAESGGSEESASDSEA